MTRRGRSGSVRGRRGGGEGKGGCIRGGCWLDRRAVMSMNLALRRGTLGAHATASETNRLCLIQTAECSCTVLQICATRGFFWPVKMLSASSVSHDACHGWITSDKHSRNSRSIRANLQPTACPASQEHVTEGQQVAHFLGTLGLHLRSNP
jgi:hypothetical protein